MGYFDVFRPHLPVRVARTPSRQTDAVLFAGPFVPGNSGFSDWNRRPPFTTALSGGNITFFENWKTNMALALGDQIQITG